MWSAGSEQHLYLDRVATEGAGLGDVLRRWKEALPEGGRRIKARVWLSGALARPFMMAPVEGLRNRVEADRAAQAMAPAETGLEGNCLVWLDAWKPAQPCLVVAVQQDIIAALQAAAIEASIGLRSVQPWWNWALSEQLKRKGAIRMLAAVERDALTVLASDGQGITFAQSCCPVPAAGRIEAQLRRQAVSQGVSASEVIRVSLGGTEGDSSPGGPVQWQESGL